MNLELGDSLDVLRNLPDNCVDSLVTDPPAGISFMNKAWDDDKGGSKQWIAWMESVMRECLRVMKPGAHGLVWAIPRTSHWTGTALENAGFEVRDVVTHLFGTGFPKSLDISKAIDKAAGAEREVIGKRLRVDGRIPADEQSISPYGGNSLLASKTTHQGNVDTAPATDAAKQWEGWGTALKPAVEIWWLVRKPLSEDTVAANVLKWSTGALNIDATRIKNDPSGSFKVGRRGQEEKQHNCNCLPDLCVTVPRVEQQIKKEPENNLQSFMPLDIQNGEQQSALEKRLSPSRWIQGDSSKRARRLRASSFDGSVSAERSNREGSGTSQKPQSCGQSDRESGTCLKCGGSYNGTSLDKMPENRPITSLGRFPANLVLSCECPTDQHDLETCAVRMLDKQSGPLKKTGKGEIKISSGGFNRKESPSLVAGAGMNVPGKVNVGVRDFGDSGGASRFFYCAKASASDKNAGLEDNEETTVDDGRNIPIDNPYLRGKTKRVNTHPTVKSTRLMEYLIKLVTPHNGTVLDPFMGSGSTGVAAERLGFHFIGIEKESDYLEIAQKRIQFEAKLRRHLE